jgi:hypothetical protein
MRRGAAMGGAAVVLGRRVAGGAAESGADDKAAAGGEAIGAGGTTDRRIAVVGVVAGVVVGATAGRSRCRHDDVGGYFGGDTEWRTLAQASGWRGRLMAISTGRAELGAAGARAPSRTVGGEESQ